MKSECTENSNSDFCYDEFFALLNYKRNSEINSNSKLNYVVVSDSVEADDYKKKTYSSLIS